MKHDETEVGNDSPWFEPRTAPEAFLQQELRAAHAEIARLKVELEAAKFERVNQTETDGDES